MAQDKKTAEAVKHEVDQLKKQIAALKEQAREQGQAFSSLDEEQLTKKVKGETSKSPFIYAQSWSSGTTPGSTANYTIYVRNPDPDAYFPFYVTIFFGLGNFFAADEAWIGRDKRWPEFSSDRTYFPANSDRSFSFSYTVPTGLPLGTYNGNSVLWRGEWHDVGTAFDRGSFDVKLL
jgi:hypothetical protein